MPDEQIEHVDNFFDMELLKERQIFLWGEIEETLCKSVVQKLIYLKNINKEPISITLCSNGGSLESELAIIDAINNIKSKNIEVHTLAIGECCSAAADILTFGTEGKRYASEHACIMFHPLSYETSLDYLGQQENIAAFLKKQAIKINKLVAKNIGKKEKDWEAKIKDGLWLTASEALKLGIIDGIL